jgi:putative ABC transport system permease protein
MTSLRVLWSRVLDPILRRSRDRRLDEEIQEHLRQLTDDYVSAGMAPDEARRAARRAFGRVPQITEAYREQRGLPIVDSLRQDVTFAARLLRRDPGFAATVIAVLALGIGVNNMLFTILNAHTLRGLPLSDADRVLFLSTFDDRRPDLGVSYLDFADWRNGAKTIASMAAFTTRPIVLSVPDRAADRFDGAFVSASTFSLIGVQPVAGRDFTAQDDRPGAPAVVILGRDAWVARYGGDPNVLGLTVSANGTPATIIGIMPERSGFPGTAQVWLPLSQLPGVHGEPRSVRPLRAMARVADGQSVVEARAELQAISDRLAIEHPDTNARVRARVVPINEQFLGSPTQPVWMAFMAAGCLVVLISCANAANLLLARSVQRAREIAIRLSLGASRRRVVRQLLVEGAMLAALGGTCGLGVASLGVAVFVAAIPEGVLPYWFDYSVDVRVLAALVAVSAATVFVFALVPAIQASRADVNRALKDGTRTGTRRSNRWATGFLAAEFGLAAILLAPFVVNLRTAAPALPTDAAIEAEGVLTAAVSLPAASYPSEERRQAFFDSLRSRLEGLPGVSAASVASVLPVSGGEERTIVLEGQPPTDAPAVRTVTITPGYFETLGVSLVRGRDFASSDGGPGQPHAIVNERFVEQFLDGRDPVGTRLSMTPAADRHGTPEWVTVVGVAPSVRQRPVPTADAVVYVPLRAAPPANAHLLVRSALDTAAVASLARDVVASIDRVLPLYRLRTLAQASRDAQWNGRVSNRLFVLLTFIAVSLATVGLYAVTAQSVLQRTQEIGVRMALGARAPQIVRLIARRVALQLCAGLLAGIAGARVWGWAFGSGRNAVNASDLVTLFSVAAILTVLAAIACVVPARRATRLDPVAAIRRD